MTNPPVTVVVDGGIARLRLACEEQGNRLDLEVARALRAGAERIRDDPQVRVVILSAAGPAFSYGGDLRYMCASNDPGAAVREMAVELHAAVAALSAATAPVIAAVQGVAAGGGLSLACGADLVVAAASARFVLGYSAIGLSPDLGATWLLPRLVGLRRAQELTLLNRSVDAAEAESIGLVTRVVADQELDAAVDELSRQLASGSPAAHAAIKQLLRDSANATLDEQLAREARTVARLAGGPDGREGLAAFIDKRPAQFGGR